MGAFNKHLSFYNFLNHVVYNNLENPLFSILKDFYNFIIFKKNCG